MQIIVEKCALIRFIGHIKSPPDSGESRADGEGKSKYMTRLFNNASKMPSLVLITSEPPLRFKIIHIA